MDIAEHERNLNYYSLLFFSSLHVPISFLYRAAFWNSQQGKHLSNSRRNKNTAWAKLGHPSGWALVVQPGVNFSSAGDVVSPGNGRCQLAGI